MLKIINLVKYLIENIWTFLFIKLTIQYLFYYYSFKI